MENVTETIGGHLVRNLVRVDDNTIIGEVAHKYCPDNWEKTRWTECNVDKGYYSTTMGEWWDINLNS